MRTSGRSIGGRLSLVLFVAFASVAAAAEIWTVDVPAGDVYLTTAVLVPGATGAEVCGERGNGHVDLRIGFGGDLKLSVNGVDAGVFDPAATYLVTVECRKVCDQWLATTRVVNQMSGAPTYEQMNYRLSGALEQVRAVAEDVIQLDIH